MILINKRSAPPGLDDLKEAAEKNGLTDQEGYDLLRNPLKTIVRDALMAEQGHLCAYCMRRIPDIRISEEDEDLSGTYIEHWQARSKTNTTSDNKGLDYQNMLAVCSGNEKAPEASGRRKKRYFTCDKKRGSRPLKVNPLDVESINSIYYTAQGIIKSDDKAIEEDITKTLNLNCDSDAVLLPQNRKAVLDAVQSEIFEQVEQGNDFLEACTEQLEIWESETDPKTPYIGIVIWWLRDQLGSLSITTVH
ncbi:MAG: hypothetical protein IJ719_23530 [Clostridia bacterium]|nr:hypothetical protein [Clostridia bacterium]